MPVVMTSDDAAIRYRLRLARTDVQVSTGSSKYRRQSLWAALQQFEELLDAAGTVGPASRPLLLFYALSQAGRAITAVHGSEPWELRGHGLEMPGPSGRENLLERTIEPRPTRNDSFHRVAQTIGSDVLTKPVELGAVWASLPYELPKAWVRRWRRALRFTPLVEFSYPSSGEPLRGQLPNLDLPEFTQDALRSYLVQYPTVKGWDIPSPYYEEGHVTFGWAPILSRKSPGRTPADWSAALTGIAPQYRYRGNHWIRPAVGPQRDYLKPLCAWWVLLFGLSIVARYEPAIWAQALSINSSELAAALESLLDEAMLSIPQLVLEAIEGRPFLVNQ